MKKYGIGGNRMTPWFYGEDVEQNAKILSRMNLDDLMELAKRRKKGVKPLLVEFLKDKV